MVRRIASPVSPSRLLCLSLAVLASGCGGQSDFADVAAPEEPDAGSPFKPGTPANGCGDGELRCGDAGAQPGEPGGGVLGGGQPGGGFLGGGQPGGGFLGGGQPGGGFPGGGQPGGGFPGGGQPGGGFLGGGQPGGGFLGGGQPGGGFFGGGQP